MKPRGPKLGERQSGRTAGNHRRIPADAARRASALRRRRAAAKPGCTSVLAPGASTSLHFWEERLSAGGGSNPEAAAAAAAAAAPSLQSWSESLRDSPACYSQRRGRAKSGWKHFSKVLTQTCSDSVFDMSDIYVRDLRKTRTGNHTYGHDLRLFIGRADPDTTATTAELGFKLNHK